MISIIIPVRKDGSPEITLKSLAGQAPDCEIVIAWDTFACGANWARNRGAERARGKYLLFSDDDITWYPGAIATLHLCLMLNPEAYAYGSYEMAGKIQCNVPFSAERLRRTNFISTMSLIRRECFPGFDENIERLQDWDLWLTMLAAGHTGAYCGKLIFSTKVRDGITENGRVSYEEARRIVSEKHKLGLT